jgi:hypothetical protein
VTATPRSFTYWLERGSHSPQSPAVHEEGGGSVVAGLIPPKPPKLVQKFWLKRLCSRARTSTLRDTRAFSSSSTSEPCPLSPYPSPGTVVKL